MIETSRQAAPVGQKKGAQHHDARPRAAVGGAIWPLVALWPARLRFAGLASAGQEVAPWSLCGVVGAHLDARKREIWALEQEACLSAWLAAFS